MYSTILGIGRDRESSDQSRLDSTEKRTKIIPRQCTKTDALVVDTLCKTGNFTFWNGLKYPIQVFYMYNVVIYAVESGDKCFH